MSILDHTQDISGTETHRLTSLHEPPEFVKEADHTRLHGDPEMLPAHVYGDQASRTWPVHAAPAVWMSSLFFFDKKAELDPAKAEVVEQRILSAADFFNIRPAVDELKTKIADSTAHDLSRVGDKDFALVYVEKDSASGKERKERHYPLRNTEEVKMAEHWFTQFRDEFLWPDRRRIAEKLHEKAAQYGVLLHDPEMIEKTAGLGHAPTCDVVEMLQQRGNMCNRSHPALAGEMTKLASIVEENGIDLRDQGVREKIATVVDQFDRETKLNRMYDEGGLDRPEESMFKLTAKHASDFVLDHMQMTSGTVYEKSAFDGMALEHVKTWLGDDFADAVSAGDLYVDPEKIADIAPTLPRGDAEMFDRMANAGGVSAYAVTKAAADEGLSTDAMYALAAAYGNAAGLGDQSVL